MKRTIRKVILPVALLTGCGSYSLAADPVWQTLGEGLHYGFTPCITIDHNDTPYVAYTYSNQPSVMKYNGSSWEYVGNANFTTGVWASFNLAINSQGIPYVAYQEDSSHGYLATSMAYNGIDTWEVVGQQGFGGVTGESTYDVSLAIDNDDIPHVIYSKKDYSTFNYMAIVYRYAYGSWSYDSAVSSADEGARSDIITVAKNNVIYIAYKSGKNSNKLTVKRKQSGSYGWSLVGSSGFSVGGVDYISLATDSNSIPYVAFQDISENSKATVMKYNDNNNTWTIVGQAGFTPGSAKDISLAIDGSDTLYIAYATNEPGDISVMKYNGSDWVNVGNANFVNGLMYRTTSLAIDSKGTPYLVYKANDGADGGKVTVMYAPSVTCKRKNQATGECIPGIEDPGWTGPYPEVPFDGNYGQGDGTVEGNRTAEPGWPVDTPYPDLPCPEGTGIQGSDECAP